MPRRRPLPMRCPKQQQIEGAAARSSSSSQEQQLERAAARKSSSSKEQQLARLQEILKFTTCSVQVVVRMIEVYSARTGTDSVL
jgi:hypothetical protein